MGVLPVPRVQIQVEPADQLVVAEDVVRGYLRVPGGRVGDLAELEVKQVGIDLQQPGDHVRECQVAPDLRLVDVEPLPSQNLQVVVEVASGQPLVGVVLSQAGLDLIELDADDGATAVASPSRNQR